ncbi:hypothetical protein BDK51DRAFT_42712 [Blyttiomyces helicus]|uniref:Uncharacterized protein n=1 Tax=Blyttiomyces helicus TaxID=388810 RepID=A0A4P9VXT8_9FUNG|nr:hypothetical protein BDK51DRAFT_42712 [Blyttiomyces helicus]|eukprot:RKO84571.1 hypothetical protein BDK51DRAFT_42712 [Blyttiomyces helicus]
MANAIISQQSSCAASATSNQNINIGPINGSVGSLLQTAQSTVTVGCMQETSNSTTLQNDISQNFKSAIQQEATAYPTFFSVNASSNVAINNQKAITNIAQNFDVNTVKNCVAKSTQEQQINIGGVGTSGHVEAISQVINASTVANCIQQDAVTNKAIDHLATTVSAEISQAASSGFNTKMFIAALCISCILFIVAGGIYFLLQDGSSGIGSSQGINPTELAELALI